MLRVIITTFLVILAQLSLLGQKPTILRADFGRDIDDWFIFDLNGDVHREILGFYPPARGQRPFAIGFLKDKRWEMIHHHMSTRVVAMVLGEFGFGPGRQIALIEPERVRFLVFRDTSFSLAPKELSFRCIIRSPLAAPPGFWHWATDVDGDGHDDLYLPGDDGIVFFFGRGRGEFSKPLEIPFAGTRVIEDESTGHLDFERSYPRPIMKDINNDQLPDLCWFDESGLSFLLQGPRREFPAKNRKTFDLAWVSGDKAGDLLEQTNTELADVNGDGLLDLFLSRMSTPASGITDMRTTLVLLLNQGGGEFLKRPDFALRIRGIIGNGPTLTDLNGDGTPDLVFGSYGTSVSDALQRAMGHVKVQFHAYMGRPNRKSPFRPQPDFSRDFRVAKADYENWGVRNNVILSEDLNGDGTSDLFVMTPKGGGHQISVFAGHVDRKQKLTFAEKPFLSSNVKDVSTVTFRTLTTGEPVRCVVIQKNALLVLKP